MALVLVGIGPAGKSFSLVKPYISIYYTSSVEVIKTLKAPARVCIYFMLLLFSLQAQANCISLPRLIT